MRLPTRSTAAAVRTRWTLIFVIPLAIASRMAWSGTPDEPCRTRGTPSASCSSRMSAWSSCASRLVMAWVLPTATARASTDVASTNATASAGSGPRPRCVRPALAADGSQLGLDVEPLGVRPVRGAASRAHVVGVVEPRGVEHHRRGARRGGLVQLLGLDVVEVERDGDGCRLGERGSGAHQRTDVARVELHGVLADQEDHRCARVPRSHQHRLGVLEGDDVEDGDPAAARHRVVHQPAGVDEGQGSSGSRDPLWIGGRSGRIPTSRNFIQIPP